MKIKPLGSKILVKVDAAEDRIGSIYIPSDAKEKPTTGTVKAVGFGLYTQNGIVVKPAVKAGDRIIFNKYGGVEIDALDKGCILIDEHDILGILTDAVE